jgi:hypothetical protein
MKRTADSKQRSEVRGQTSEVRSRTSNQEFLSSDFCPPTSEKGVALIITLIMLAVITFMATTFLVLSRRERNAVTQTTDQTVARFTADTALEQAKFALMSGIFGTNDDGGNPLANLNNTADDQNFDLMVPTNYFNPFGFQTGIGSVTNVNYFYANGQPVNQSDFLINLTNLLYNPRPPVFVTNRFTGRMEFRYFLDLNRNGAFDPSGEITNIIRIGAGGFGPGGLGNVIGDPQWIGVLRFPDRPHSANNPFVSRWTYIVVPADKTLDVNYLHNQTRNTTSPLSASDGYVRNQGVGPWEINLAAFFADLNTNNWYRDNGQSPAYYQYNWPFGGAPNLGFAFDDARSLISYRYAGRYDSLQRANTIFGYAAAPLATDGIDEYSDGNFMGGTTPPIDTDNVNEYWAGSDNPRHYFTSQDFFDPAKTSPTFVSRLQSIGFQPDTYDRYTFYRMIAQLGTDSQPERKINLNYLNVDTNGNIVAGMETNLISWADPAIGAGGISVNGREIVPPNGPPGALLFFKSAAAAMFEKMDLHEDGLPFRPLITVTNIPIWPTNYYTPAVHRILQLAANIFEATTNSPYPCIYRPLFSADNNHSNVWISGYELVNGPDMAPTPPLVINQAALDINDSVVRNAIDVAPLQSQRNLYGVPWVIGARKGFPNLNEIGMQSICQMTRKVQVTRPLTRSSWNGYSAKQMFIIGVSNTIGVEFWNSYNKNYVPRFGSLTVKVEGTTSVALTNDLSYASPAFTFNLAGTITTNLWGGTGMVPAGPGTSRKPAVSSFIVPLLTNLVVVPDSYAVANRLFPVSQFDGNTFWLSIPQNNLALPNWWVNLTNNVRCIVMDGGRVIDYAQFSHLEAPRNLTLEAQTYLNQSPVDVWGTNTTSAYWGNIPEGILRQIMISVGTPPTPGSTDWANNGLDATTRSNAIAYFFGFMFNPTITSNSTQVPFSPTAKMSLSTRWQANDPLVHYLAEDLTDLSKTNLDIVRPPNSRSFPLLYTNLWKLTERYAPWGGAPLKPDAADPNNFNTAVKDPLVRTSDEWDFPTNKFPNVGWLGRVHRGTPWQTMYMKSADETGNNAPGGIYNWRLWASDTAVWPPGSTNAIFDAVNTSPINDRKFFDIFTASPNENATRARLSVNQTNLAAWSAILTGVLTLTNDPATASASPFVISPAGADPSSAMFQIWTNINGARANTNPAVGPVFANHQFQDLGDFLATPFLSDEFPMFVKNWTDGGGNQIGLQSLAAGGITDEVMERIPQQILGLLTVSHSPRFVVYSYGQALRPAPSSVITAGPFNGVCTNYQVTAETATRAVVRVVGSPNPRYTTRRDRFGNQYPPQIVVEQFNVLPPD